MIGKQIKEKFRSNSNKQLKDIIKVIKSLEKKGIF